MTPALTIGLSGGIGSGKSTVLAELKRLGADAFSADDVVRELSKRGRPMHRAIVREFGAKYLDERGEIDRPALAKAAFSRPGTRRRLEKATHPLVWSRMNRRLAASRRRIAVADVPLLFETRAQGRFDATVLVVAPRAAAVRRVMRRDGLSKTDIAARMRAQMPQSEKINLADVIIDNGGGLRRLRESVGSLYKALDLIANGAARAQGSYPFARSRRHIAVRGRAVKPGHRKLS